MSRAPRRYLAFRQSVVVRAAVIAAIVGPVLAIINHGDTLLAGELHLSEAVKIIVTFLVPYTVSTVSSVFSIREQEALLSQLGDPTPVGSSPSSP
ncbi:nitrate/nitrite transporter NrtS [Paracoccus sp. P2]|uniref:nitrate/nitrite transporter NrtS n=1 Tax=Paracoccus sp. P2 TaxID=3248840 RepID=UPI00391F7806